MSAIPNLPENIINVAHSASDENTATESIGSKENGAPQLAGELQLNDITPTVESQSIGASLKRSWKLHDVAVENHRPMKAIVIGAGYSGIYCGIRIPERIRNCELTIYEKNAGYGGAWYENRYPGCACDVPCEYFSRKDGPGWN